MDHSIVCNNLLPGIDAIAMIKLKLLDKSEILVNYDANICTFKKCDHPPIRGVLKSMAPPPSEGSTIL